MENPYDSPEAFSGKHPKLGSFAPSLALKIITGLAALYFGVVFGSVVNFGLIWLGGLVVPLPAGFKNLPESIHLFGPQHFIFPFLAHALGTLVGAIVAFVVALSYRSQFAYAIGLVFFAGGVAMSLMVPAPIWFVVVDLVFAYFPMAYLATRIGYRNGLDTMTERHLQKIANNRQIKKDLDE